MGLEAGEDEGVMFESCAHGGGHGALGDALADGLGEGGGGVGCERKDVGFGEHGGVITASGVICLKICIFIRW